MKLGIAISLYDKYDFLMTNINVLRKHWKNEVSISVCCNHEPTFKKISEDGLVDNLHLGNESKLDPVKVGKDIARLHPKIIRRLRQYDCVSSSITNASKNSDYVIHWHTDAFALNEDAVYSLVSLMKKNNYKFLGRGFWTDYISQKTPFGDVDDHFFIVDSSVVGKIFNHQMAVKNALDNFAMEGNLVSLVRCALKEEEIHIYSDMSECEVKKTSRIDKRYKDKIPHRTLPPINIDPTRGLVHCDIYEELPQIFDRFGVSKELIYKNNS